MQQHARLVFENIGTFDDDLVSFLSPADQVAFERQYGTGMGHFESEQRLEWLLFFVWRAWRRETKATVGFEEFLEALTEYDLPTGDAEAVPTTESLQPA